MFRIRLTRHERHVPHHVWVKSEMLEYLIHAFFPTLPGGFLPIIIDTEARLPLKIRPLMLIGFVGYSVSYVIAFLSFPDESIFGDTNAVAFMPGK